MGDPPTQPANPYIEFLLTQLFLTYIYLLQGDHYFDKYFSDPTFFRTNNFFRQRIFPDPIFVGSKNFKTQYFFRPSIFSEPNICSEPNFFGHENVHTKKCLDPKNVRPKKFQDQHFFYPDFYFNPNFFSDPKFLDYMFQLQNFSDSIFFQTNRIKKISDPEYCQTTFFVTQSFSGPNFFYLTSYWTIKGWDILRLSIVWRIKGKLECGSAQLFVFSLIFFPNTSILTINFLDYFKSQISKCPNLKAYIKKE